MKRIEGKDVNAFTGLTVEQANKFMKDKEAGFTQTEDGWICKTCGATIMQTTLYVSVHEKDFGGCAGSGKVQTVPFPYCPACDGEPKMVRGCVHV